MSAPFDHNPRKKPNRRWTAQENALIDELYRQGVGPAQIACRVGATRYMIEAKLRKWGVERTLRGPSA